ncbi:DMT family transporter [Priestia megaterium]|uniref:DMT family transporter n=1 Tax=Priestia megaterium TaxID=1404 RepID=UPI00366F0AD6
MARFSYLFIILGATLWGIIGLFVNALSNLGFSSLQIVAIRVIVAASVLLLYVLIRKPKLLKIEVRDIKYFLGTGICSIVFFNWCYFTAIKETSVAVASILLYTAPAFVIIISRILFKELITVNKIYSLIVALLGCILVVGGASTHNQSISSYGLLLGLGSGFGYSLYSIFSKIALTKYTVVTITTYTFVVASIVIVPISGIWNSLPLLIKPTDYFYALGLGVLSTVLAFGLYSLGLVFVESSKASIVAVIEPVVATLIGVLIFGESLTIWQISGILLIVFSVFLVQGKVRKVAKPNLET